METQSPDDWRQKALCKNLRPEQADEIFFIGPGKSSKRAKLFCRPCPVRQNCNEFAVMYNETGIWAGNTDEDRRNLDPFIGDVLRSQAQAAGTLESRNLNDFIPQVRHQCLQATAQALEDFLAEERILLEIEEAKIEREAEQLAAQDPQCDEPTFPQDCDL